jgi:hypothetical protein
MDKESQKGMKKGAENQGVYSSLFSALLRFLLFSDFIQYRTLDLDFLDLHPFCMLKLKRGKNPEKNSGNTKKGGKREEKRLL